VLFEGKRKGDGFAAVLNRRYAGIAIEGKRRANVNHFVVRKDAGLACVAHGLGRPV